MRFLGIFLVLLMQFSATANAAPCPEWVAKAVSIQGAVELRVSKADPNISQRWQPVKRGDSFCANDVVRVKANSRAALILTNDTVLRLDQNTTITFTNLSANKASQISLLKGIAHFISRVKQAFEVVTPFVNAAVEGTEFVVAANDKQSQVTVLEGKVRVSNTSGEVLLSKNQIAITQKGQAPVLDIRLKPRDAVQWALFYPRIVDTTSSDSKSLINSAASKLALGRVKEALNDLNKVETSSSSYTDALALKAIIALVNNDKSSASAFANQAYARDKQNVSAILAVSYVQQAHFNIEAALEPLHQYNKLNALIYARMAEVYLMLGDLDNALRHAEQAVKLDAQLSNSQSVLGYANLTKNNTKNAELNFKMAIQLDQATPLPHLGLGLALIRQGHLEQGRREIEYATSLDPNNALIRSYLGKAYYEEKRDKVAIDQFDMAKDLDAKDPTAWFYSAIQKQSNNRPVEALQDLQTSAELNDNRAVYRSRLLLDEDQAARSSGLARVYSDLGFEQLAQQQAYNSINNDFTNYSAHRFLAESYGNRSRHEIGRVSELLQAQLLAPINVSPVAPHLSETQLGIQSNAGPSGASFNQYDPLFARNQSRLQLSALAGNNNTYGDEVAYSQLFDNTSLSLGQYHYETDGFRSNNDYKQDILNGFVQTNLTSNQSVQFEVKKNKTKNGDLRLRFDPTDFTNNRREILDETSYRLGYHNKISSTSTLLVSAIQSDSVFTRDYTAEQISPTGPLGPILAAANRSEDSKSKIAELQYISKEKNYDYMVGIGSYDYVKDASGVITLTSGATTLSTTQIQDIDRSLTNGYIYSHWNSLDSLSLTFGVSHNSIDDPVFDTNQINPKLGLKWDISPQAQIRFAAFRTLKRPVKAEQTIEPTQVAGFNQFYDDPTAADAKNYGFAYEHRISNKLFTGIELTKRDLYVPYKSGANKELEIQSEYDHRAYVYWTLSNTTAISVEYQYEAFDRERKDFTNQPKRLITHILPISLKVNYPSGWSGSLTSSYYDQDINQPISTTAFINNKDQFWMADLNIGYRVSKRLGTINLEVRNLFDENFMFYDAAFRADETSKPATLYHERSIWLRLALTFD